MKNKGFTLIELTVSLCIFSMLLGGIFYAVGTELNYWERIVTASEDLQITNMVRARIVRDIRSANMILPDSDAQGLRLKAGADTIEYFMLNKKIGRKNNGNTAYLTDTGDLAVMSFAYPAENLVEITVGSTTTRILLRNRK